MPVLGITGGIATGKSTFTLRLKDALKAAVFDADATARELLESDLAVREEIAVVFGPDVVGPDGLPDRRKLREMVFTSGKGASPESVLHHKEGNIVDWRDGLSGRDSSPGREGVMSSKEGGRNRENTDSKKASYGHLPSEARARLAGDRPEALTAGGTWETMREVTVKARSASGLAPVEDSQLHGKKGAEQLDGHELTPRQKLEAILHPRIRERWLTAARELRQREGEGGDTEWLLVDLPLLFEIGAQDYFHEIITVACSEATRLERLLKGRGLAPEVASGIIRAQEGLASKMNRSSLVIWSESTLELLQQQVDLLAVSLKQRYG